MKTSRQARAHFVLGAVVGALAFVYSFSPTTHNFYPQCPIWTTFHLRCPGCGTTRALYELLHLHLGAAMRANLLTTPLMLLAATFLLYTYVMIVWQNRVPSLRIPGRVWGFGAAAALLFMVLRNLSALV